MKSTVEIETPHLKNSADLGVVQPNLTPGRSRSSKRTQMLKFITYCLRVRSIGPSPSADRALTSGLLKFSFQLKISDVNLDFIQTPNEAIQ